MKEIKKMKVAELRAELKRRGLATDGLKAVLAKRLEEDEEAKQAAAEAKEVEEAKEEAEDEEMEAKEEVVGEVTEEAEVEKAKEEASAEEAKDDDMEVESPEKPANEEAAAPPAEEAKLPPAEAEAVSAGAEAPAAAPAPLPPPPPPPPVEEDAAVSAPAATASAPQSQSSALAPGVAHLLSRAAANLESTRVHHAELESALLLSASLLAHPAGLSTHAAKELSGLGCGSVRDAWHALGDGCRPLGVAGGGGGGAGEDVAVLGIEASGGAAIGGDTGTGGAEGMEAVIGPGQLGAAARSAALCTALDRAVEVAGTLQAKSDEGGQQQRIVSDVRDALRRIDDDAAASDGKDADGNGDVQGGATDLLLEAFYARLAEVREYHAKHERAEEAAAAPAATSTNDEADANADAVPMDIDESSRRKILALTTTSTSGSKRRKIRHGNPQADGYDLHSLLLTEMAKVRGGDAYSPQEVFGRYLDLTDVHDGLASGSAALRAELAKVAASATSSASADNKEEEKKDDDANDDPTSSSTSAATAFPYVDFLSLLTKPLATLLSESTKLNKHRKAYVRFLSALYNYLLGFLRRTTPLLDAEGEVIRPVLEEFERTWSETGGCPGWVSREAEKVLASPPGVAGAAVVGPSSSSSNTGTSIDLSSYSSPQKLCDAVDADTLKAELSRIGLKCGGAPLDRAQRLFLLKDTTLSDLPKKCWAKGRGPPPSAATGGDAKPEGGAADGTSGDNQASSSALTSASLAGSSRRIDVARLEVATQSLLDQLRPTLDATARRAERQLYQTPNEREVELDEEINGIAGMRGKKSKEGREKGEGGEDGGESDDDSDEDDAPIYNPKGVPLGWDGKPIPYWLFKLHGLNHFYSCEICGNESYRGRHNFEKHFQDSKHVYGMRCLGIPNTRHFHGVTKIEDAQRLWAKLQQTVEGNAFDGEKEEEYEDSHGNVLTRKTYQDLARQGLL